MGRILMIAADGTAIDHLDYAWFRMKEAGHQTDIVSLAKRPIKSAVHWGGPDTFVYYIEKPGYPHECHLTFDEVDPSLYDGLILPGGRAPEYLRNDERVGIIIRHFIDNDKPVAAVCHGPLLLLAAGVTGKRMVTADDLEHYVNRTGNQFLTGHKGEVPGELDFTVDGNLVTGRGYWHFHSWMREFLRLLEERGVKGASLPPARNLKVLILTGEHASSGQVAYAYERTLEAGYEAHLVGPDQRLIKTIIDPREEGWDMIADTDRPYDFESLGFIFWASAGIDDIDPADYDAMLIPGGRAPEYLANMPGYIRAVRHFVESGKPIAAIDQGARMLLTGGVTGRRLTGIDMIRKEVETDNIWANTPGAAVVDGNIATVSGRPYYHEWMRAFFSLLQ